MFPAFVSSFRLLPVRKLAALFAGCGLCVAGLATAGRSLQAAEPGPQAAASGPAMRLDHDTYDFGQVQQGQKIRHAFTFTNPGTQPLRIKEIKPGCSCTLVKSWDARIAPNGRGAIELELDTADMLDRVRKKVSIKTNIRAEPEKTVWLQGRVTQAVQIKPEAAVFGLLEPGRPQTKTILLSRPQAGPLDLKILQNHAPGFKVRLKALTTGRQYQLDITSSPDLISGPQTGGVLLQASLPAVSNLWVPVCAYVPPAWDVRPRKILLPGAALPATAHKLIYVHPAHDRRRKIRELRSNIPGLTYELRREFWHPVTWITVNLPPGFTPAGRPDWLIELQTDDPDFPQLEIPVAADNGTGGAQDAF